jgi:hemoglobin-like flavoprotein
MSNAISENTRKSLFRSLAAVETNKLPIVIAMTGSLAAAEAESRSVERSEIIVVVLLEMLIEQAKHLIEGQDAQNLEAHARRHEQYGIAGRHYSRFGDALVPVLRDVLGPNLPRGFASAWCDVFWFVIRSINQHEEPQEAELLRA